MQTFKVLSKEVKEGQSMGIIKVLDNSDNENKQLGIMFSVLENLEEKESGSSVVVAGRQASDGTFDWREGTLVSAMARAIRLQAKVDIALLPKLSKPKEKEEAKEEEKA